MTENYDFIVIGAGLSGLAAARDLSREGHRVLVLEGQKEIGGRFRSVEWNGGVSDIGAQFISSDYPRIHRLIHELGLEKDASLGTREMGIFKNKKLYTLGPTHPRSPFQLFSVSSLFRLLKVMIKLRHSKEDLERITAWKGEDDLNAKDWSLQKLDAELLNSLITPVLSGFNYSDPEEASSYLALKNLSYIKLGGRTFGLKHGLGQLTNEMAKSLEVKCEQKVLNIEKVQHGLQLKTSDHVYTAKKVILATTAPVARSLHPGPGKIESAAMDVEYGSCTLLLLSFKGSARKGLCYGTMLVGHPDFNVLTIENGKNPWASSEGRELVHLLSTHAGHSKSENELLASALDILKTVTGLDALLDHKFFRWADAIPKHVPGHARLISRYRDELKPEQDLFLAGDYMGTPCSEGAIESGQLIASLFKKKTTTD